MAKKACGRARSAPSGRYLRATGRCRGDTRAGQARRSQGQLGGACRGSSLRGVTVQVGAARSTHVLALLDGDARHARHGLHAKLHHRLAALLLAAALLGAGIATGCTDSASARPPGCTKRRLQARGGSHRPSLRGRATQCSVQRAAGGAAPSVASASSGTSSSDESSSSSSSTSSTSGCAGAARVSSVSGSARGGAGRAGKQQP